MRSNNLLMSPGGVQSAWADIALPLPQPGNRLGYGAAATQLQKDIAGTIANGFADAQRTPQVSAVALNAFREAALSALPPNATRGLTAGLSSSRSTLGRATAVPVPAPARTFGVDAPGKRAFVDRMLPFARAAADQLGISEDLVLAHAALESGWGRRPIEVAQGDRPARDSHNLFGIKAGGSWRGRVADVTTTEYYGGESIKTVERFRAYPGYQAAFNDYVALLRDNPRYSGITRAGASAEAFGAALQQGGYATDPAYAEKLRRVGAEVSGVRVNARAVAGLNRGAR